MIAKNKILKVIYSSISNWPLFSPPSYVIITACMKRREAEILFPSWCCLGNPFSNRGVAPSCYTAQRTIATGSLQDKISLLSVSLHPMLNVFQIFLWSLSSSVFLSQRFSLPLSHVHNTFSVYILIPTSQEDSVVFPFTVGGGGRVVGTDIFSIQLRIPTKIFWHSKWGRGGRVIPASQALPEKSCSFKK